MTCQIIHFFSEFVSLWGIHTGVWISIFFHLSNHNQRPVLKWLHSWQFRGWKETMCPKAYGHYSCQDWTTSNSTAKTRSTFITWETDRWINLPIMESAVIFSRSMHMSWDVIVSSLPLVQWNDLTIKYRSMIRTSRTMVNVLFSH